jgi:RimJ/RimL family protein N-acetyltransferase
MMTVHERRELILKSKTKGQVICGKCIDLRPCTIEHGENIVYLRNQEKSRYFFNQPKASTIEGQNSWYSDYVKRDNDIYWCIHTKNEKMIGTVRLYAIDLCGGSCEEGSFVIDEAYAMSGPYALEAKITVFDFAFDELQILKVVNEDRIDNKNMNSINKRIGFQIIKESEQNGVKFSRKELTKDLYKREPLYNILEKWNERE